MKDVINKVFNYIKNLNYKRLLFIPIILVLFAIILVVYKKVENNNRLYFTIDDVNYNEEDFYMYSYLVKVDYFGIDNTIISKDTLDTQVSSEEDKTIGEFLKEKTDTKMKISAAILRIANENNISLTKDDNELIEKSKKDFIDSLGGYSNFINTLKENNTSYESYMKALKIEVLYEKIYNNLYSEGKRNDLSNEEVTNAYNEYYNNYYKVKEIVLNKKEDNKYLSDTLINQKSLLINTLKTMIISGEDIDSLITKYSESYSNDVYSYYRLDKTDDKIINELNNVSNYTLTNVIETDDAYYLMVKCELDDKYLIDYYNEKREDKLIENISNNTKKLAIRKGKYYNDIVVK